MYSYDFVENNTLSQQLIKQLTNLKREITQGTVAKDKQDPDQRKCNSNDPHFKQVCDEYYRGPYFGFWHDGGWVTDSRNCSLSTKRIQIKSLITVLLVYKEKYLNENVIQFAKRFSEDLDLYYPGMAGMIATKTQLPSSAYYFQIKNVEIIKFSISSSESDMWLSLIQKTKTPYVLLGRSIHTFCGKWANLERSIRLLGSKYEFSSTN